MLVAGEGGADWNIEEAWGTECRRAREPWSAALLRRLAHRRDIARPAFWDDAGNAKAQGRRAAGKCGVVAALGSKAAEDCGAPRRCRAEFVAIIAVLILLGVNDRLVAGDAPRLKVSENGHHLVTEGGAPFFYLADTAWELFHRSKFDQAEIYLKHRARNGFTVVHAAILAEIDGLNTPNALNNTPLKDNDPAEPNRRYFRDVDFVVTVAEKQGLVMGLAPTWGDKWNKRWGLGPEVFDAKNARTYGVFVGDRYKDRAVFWILGGDRNPDREAHLEIIQAMAEGIRDGSDGRQLITYLPAEGGNSAKWFHDAKWLDFHMIHSGQRVADGDNYSATISNFRLKNPKPTLDGGSRWEDHPVGWDDENGWFDEYDARQAAFWAFLSGASGHAYGHHGIWQFWDASRSRESHVRTPWVDALGAPGGMQMKHVRTLFEARRWHRLVPDQGVIAGNPRQGADHVRAARAEDGSFVIVYSPTGRSVTVNLGKVKSEKVRALWYNPREGKAGVIGEYDGGGKKTFEFFSHGRGNDWILILEDPAKGFSLPGGSGTK